ncbi:MAG: MBL fold metallo-hydrolase [Kofleriaceae bacterium]|nr:MBL fold metallo-hydrolase [Kofleriaceae bacterium]
MRPITAVVAAVVATVAAGPGCLVVDTAPARHAHPTAPAPARDTDEVTVTWIGHATCLIGVAGHWFLTDPVLGRRIAGVLPRRIAAGIDPADLPPLDAVLISHAHFDHLDLPSLREVDAPVVLVPPGVAGLLPDDVAPRATAVDTWGTWRRGDVTITAVPASHGDGRWGVDVWRRHAHTGWVIEVGDRTIYFAGDTGYVPAQARALRARFHVDVALIPVGPAGRPRWVEWLRRRVHATPSQAMALFEDTGAQWMVPIHYGTFFEDLDHEAPVLRAAIAEHELDRRVRVLAVGDTAAFLY